MVLEPEKLVTLAKWRTCGEGNLSYSIPCAFMMKDQGLLSVYENITEPLGYVKKKNDGRYEWFIKPIKYNKVWPVTEHKQGVCFTQEEAIRIVESQWKN